jgi:hypothetical protein
MEYLLLNGAIALTFFISCIIILAKITKYTVTNILTAFLFGITFVMVAGIFFAAFSFFFGALLNYAGIDLISLLKSST